MARKWLALLLVALGAAGLFPYMQNVLALSQGTVKGHSTDRSTYAVTAISSTNQLVSCTGKPIRIQRNTTDGGNWFRCWTNYDAAIPMRWELADPADPLIASVATPTPVTLSNTDTGNGQCRYVEMTARFFNNDTSGTVVFRGKSVNPAADFYVEVNFPVQVTVQKNKGGTGATCP